MPYNELNKDPFAGAVLNKPDPQTFKALALFEAGQYHLLKDNDWSRIAERAHAERESHAIAMKAGERDVRYGAANSPNAQTYLASRPQVPRQQAIDQLMQQPQVMQPAPFSPRNIPGKGEMTEVQGVPVYGGGMDANTPRPAEGYGYVGGINPKTGEPVYVSTTPEGLYTGTTPITGPSEIPGQPAGIAPVGQASLVGSKRSTFEELVQGKPSFYLAPSRAGLESVMPRGMFPKPAPVIDVTGPGQPAVPIINVGQPPVIDITGPGKPAVPTIDVTGPGVPSPDYVSPLYSPYSALFNKQGQFDVVRGTGNYQSPFYSPYANVAGEAQSQMRNYVAPTASPIGEFAAKRPMSPEEVARSLLGVSSKLGGYSDFRAIRSPQYMQAKNKAMNEEAAQTIGLQIDAEKEKERQSLASYQSSQVPVTASVNQPQQAQQIPQAQNVEQAISQPLNLSAGAMQAAPQQAPASYQPLQIPAFKPSSPYEPMSAVDVINRQRSKSEFEQYNTMAKTLIDLNKHNLAERREAYKEQRDSVKDRLDIALKGTQIKTAEIENVTKQLELAFKMDNTTPREIKVGGKSLIAVPTSPGSAHIVEVKDDATALEKNMAVRMATYSAYQQAVKDGKRDLAEQLYTALNPNWQATNPYAFKFAWEQGIAANAGGGQQVNQGKAPKKGDRKAQGGVVFVYNGKEWVASK